MNRGGGHAAVFFSDHDRSEFLRLLQVERDRHDVSTLAFCLMGNHFHLLLRAPSKESLSRAMQHLSSTFTRHTNRRVGRDGPLYRGRFHSIPVETEGYLVRATRYIHRNPLDIRGVDSLRNYVWSSYGLYLGLRPAPELLDPAPVMSLLGNDRAELIDITEDPDDIPVRAATVDEVRSVVAWAIALEVIEHDTTPTQGLDRTVATLLADRDLEPCVHEALVEALPDRSTRAARMARRRARDRLETEPMVGRVLARAEAELAHGVRARVSRRRDAA